MSDRFTVRAVAVFLGVITWTIVLVAGALAFADHSVPDPLWGLGGAALGSLGTLLARTGSDAATPVQVMNEENQPVPVDTAP